MSTMPVAEFLNVREAAEQIGCTEGRVRQMLIAGDMKGKKANARAWLIPSTEVERMAAREYTTGRRRTRDAS
jgi:excisionase family DNA binding protein